MENSLKREQQMSNSKKALIFLFPSWLLLLIFFVGPVILTFIFSFTNLALTGAEASQLRFIGFENFVRMFNDPAFQTSVREKNRAFRRVVGLIIIAAWVTPEVVVSFCWVAFLGDSGTANWLMGLMGFDPVAWLFAFPMISVVVANIWRGTAFSMMVFQSALDEIPKEVEEAAVMDGASRWQWIRKITIPMVKGTIATNLMLVTLQTLGVFTLIYTMTGGGPGNQTATLPVFMYKQAFVSYQLGYGTAISLVLLLIGAAASLIYMKMLKVKV